MKKEKSVRQNGRLEKEKSNRKNLKMKAKGKGWKEKERKKKQEEKSKDNSTDCKLTICNFIMAARTHFCDNDNL